jgi:LacI family transcriptional regulator
MGMARLVSRTPAASRILAAGPGKYDGVIAASDLIAIGIAQLLAEATGFTVPADVAITGYDNNHFASESSVPITTVAQPGKEMGSGVRNGSVTTDR